MFGIGGIIKAIIALIIVVSLLFVGWYITNIKADLVTSEMNNKALQDGIKEQQALMQQMQADIESIKKINEELNTQKTKLEKDKNDLTSKFDKRDFGKFAAEKPELVQNLINRGTDNALRCLELASGAPLNDKEKSAKTPKEANRECPSLVVPSYTAPAN